MLNTKKVTFLILSILITILILSVGLLCFRTGTANTGAAITSLGDLTTSQAKAELKKKLVGKDDVCNRKQLGDEKIVVTINGNDYQVVYKIDNILVLWMTTPYIDSVWETTRTNGLTADLYASSDIQAKLDADFETLIPSTLQEYILTPNEVNKKLNVDLQSINSDQKTDSVFSFMLDLESPQVSKHNYMTEATLNKKIWLPSYYEVFHSGNETANTLTQTEMYNKYGYWGYGGNPANLGLIEEVYNGGLWGLSYTDRMFTSNLCNSVWLRSGLDTSQMEAIFINNNGEMLGGDFTSALGVRPAMYLDTENFPFEINFDCSESGNTFQNKYYCASNKKIDIKFIPNNQNLNLITDNFGNYISLEAGVGENIYYEFKISKNADTGEYTFRIYNPKNNIQFNLRANYCTVTNLDKTNIINVSAVRSTNTFLIITIQAKVLSDYLKIELDSFVLKIDQEIASGRMSDLSYNYTFGNNTLLLKIATSKPITSSFVFSTYKEYSNTISVTSENLTLLDNYSVANKGNLTFVEINPVANIYIKNFEIDSIVYEVEYFSKEINNVNNTFKLFYMANETSNKLVILAQYLTMDLEIKITFTDIAPKLTESSIQGVAVNTTMGGDAKIIANNLNDKDSLEETVTLIAWVNAGYAFNGWSIDGGKTYLKDGSNNAYGPSATIPAYLVKNKVVTACFSKLTVNENVNGETDSDINLFP